jgi:predicted nuclease with TOPRIM domain
MTAIAQALGAFKALKDIGEATIGLANAATFRERQIEFQGKIIDAQSALMTLQQERSTLLERIGQLEAEVAQLKAWETEKQRYELKQWEPHGIFAYAVKEDARGAEPEHWICPDCYQNRQISILQPVVRFPGRAEVRICQQCGWEAYTRGGWQPEHTGSRSAARR